MTTSDAQPEDSPAGTGAREFSDLAILNRMNHDMRSPLSVILGVFDLLEDTASLSVSERRYMALGVSAAEELRDIADAIRLHTALEHDVLRLDTINLDLLNVTREPLRELLAAKDVGVENASSPDKAAMVCADEHYLQLAVAGLARYFAANLPESDHRTTLFLAVHHSSDNVTLVLDGNGDAPDRLTAESTRLHPAHVALSALNGIRLVASMDGRAIVEPARRLLQITLPAAASVD
jgi:signal transduction histidine kinase